MLLAVGAGAIAEGYLSVGDFVALLLYVERLVFPTALLGFTITAYQRGEVSIDRVEAILDAEPKIQDDPAASPFAVEQVQGQIEASNLSFTYPGSSSPALEQVNFTIYPGETIAIVGPIGAGKSTLANALPRLLDIQPGQLRLDGQDITSLRLHDLRRAIAYVPQESFLFSTSIKNNIRYGSPLMELPEVQYAAKQAQMDQEIQNFPKQYETIVGERGITLSGGQRQRTALARALLVDAPILVLDDALSSVDNRTATEILNALSAGTHQKNGAVYFPPDVCRRHCRPHLCDGSGPHCSDRLPCRTFTNPRTLQRTLGTTPTGSGAAIKGSGFRMQKKWRVSPTAKPSVSLRAY